VTSRDALIVDGVRTGLTKSWRGTFNLTRPDDMAAHCIQALLQRNPQVAAAEFEDCVIGCAYPEVRKATTSVAMSQFSLDCRSRCLG